jgi:hypothetical protein
MWVSLGLNMHYNTFRSIYSTEVTFMRIARGQLNQIIKEEISLLQQEGALDAVVDAPSLTTIPATATIDLRSIGLGIMPINVKVINDVRSYSPDIMYVMIGSQTFYLDEYQYEPFKAGSLTTLKAYIAQGTTGSASSIQKTPTPIVLKKTA